MTPSPSASFCCLILAACMVGFGCKPSSEQPSSDQSRKPEGTPPPLATAERAPAFSTNVGRLTFQGATPTIADLEKVVSVNFSPDGNYAYSSAWNPGRLTVLSRDDKTGELFFVQTIPESEELGGAVSLRLSHDGKYAVAAAFRANTVLLFKRDNDSGKLARLDVAREGQANVSGLKWVIRASFSPDAKFIYALADNSAALAGFRISPTEKLEFIEANFGEENCFQGARGLALSPDGKFIYVASARAGTLVVLVRDETSGKTRLHQIIRDEVENVHALAGAFSVTSSPDGNFVYVSSGRFGGDNAVSVFRKNPDGKLALVQEMVNGTPDLNNFLGGNDIIVSADGLNVYAVASVSHGLACFSRDPATGRLKLLETLLDQANQPLQGVSGVGISPDGKYVYAAAEGNNAISIFNRAR